MWETIREGLNGLAQGLKDMTFTPHAEAALPEPTRTEAEMDLELLRRYPDQKLSLEETMALYQGENLAKLAENGITQEVLRGVAYRAMFYLEEQYRLQTPVTAMGREVLLQTMATNLLRQELELRMGSLLGTDKIVR